MKKYGLPLLALLLAFTCFACGKDKTDTSSSFPDSQPSESVSQPVESPSEEPIVTESELSPERLAELSALFSMGTWYNYALSSSYASPEEVDFYSLFYDGDPTATITNEERAFLSRLPNAEYFFLLDVSKITREHMDSVLRTYFGLGLEDTQCIGLEYFIYCVTTDAYFHSHGDTTADLYTFTHGLELANGDVELYYHRTWDAEPFYCIVTLHQAENGVWQLVSNLPVEGYGK